MGHRNRNGIEGQDLCRCSDGVIFETMTALVSTVVEVNDLRASDQLNSGTIVLKQCSDVSRGCSSTENDDISISKRREFMVFATVSDIL